MDTLKPQLMGILNKLPSRKHAMVFVDALANAKFNIQQEGIQDPTLNEVMSEVVGVLEGWIESVNYSLADPTDNHKKSKIDDVVGETCNIFKSLGYNY
jgi:hypothetical protein